jgi:AraC family transcriptional regulator of adaptative response / DNA-3-methyladenine glycosylase II
VLTARQPFNAAAALAFLARRAIPGVERVDGGRYERRLPGGPVAADVDATGVRVRRGDPAALARLFDLDADPVAIDAHLAGDEQLAPLVRARPGLRSPGALDEAEVLARAIVGQQVAVTAARTLLGRLAADHGRDGCFPTPAQLAAADPGALPMPRARGRSLVAAMAAVAEDPGILRDRDRLLGLSGVGPWTADYVALRLGDPDAFLPTDLVVRRAMADLGMEAGRDARWRPLRAYALHHLWTSRLPG